MCMFFLNKRLKFPSFNIKFVLYACALFTTTVNIVYFQEEFVHVFKIFKSLGQMYLYLCKAEQPLSNVRFHNIFRRAQLKADPSQDKAFACIMYLNGNFRG